MIDISNFLNKADASYGKEFWILAIIVVILLTVFSIIAGLTEDTIKKRKEQ